MERTEGEKWGLELYGDIFDCHNDLEEAFGI